MVNSIQQLSYRLLPGLCQLCLAKTHRKSELCEPCQRELPWLGTQCLCCALPLADGGLCGQCLQSPPRFDRCHAAWAYHFPVDNLISRFKYQRRFIHGELLATLWLEHMAAGLAPRPDLLVAVPMHWRRLWQRGFNQAAYLAHHWGRALDIPLYQGLRRPLPTPAQQGLTARQRRRNLREAFLLTDAETVRDRHIAIVDDVLTTGATVDSVAGILREAGAATLSVWCLARTP